MLSDEKLKALDKAIKMDVKYKLAPVIRLAKQSNISLDELLALVKESYEFKLSNCGVRLVADEEALG